MKALLSLIIVFHLFAVIVAPNMESYLGEMSQTVVQPYVQLLELSNRWSFFAPDPGPPPVFLEYEVRNAAGESLAKGRWPETPDPFFLRERQTRRIAATEFMMLSDERIEKMMLPYLCRRNPGAASVSIWKGDMPIPSMADVRSGKAFLGDPSRTRREMLSHSFCEGLL